MPRQTLALLIAFALGLLSAPLVQHLTGGAAAAQTDCRTFVETGQIVCGKFLQYWNEHGGLAQQGYPISGEFEEMSDLDHKPYTVQYFERAVFELHPENQPPYDVLLAQLGTYRYQQRYPHGAPTPTATPADAWVTLRQRPLKLPTVIPGRPCPIGPAQIVSPAFGTALGTGPIYPVGLGTDAVLTFSSAGFNGPWGGQKVLWVGDPAYHGLALVRGHQLDGPNEVRFNTGTDPAAELRLDTSKPDNTTGGWANWPSYTRVRAPGCYAYQVDGSDFSLVIPFTAVSAPAP
jgi:hypothetical protein